MNHRVGTRTVDCHTTKADLVSEGYFSNFSMSPLLTKNSNGEQYPTEAFVAKKNVAFGV